MTKTEMETNKNRARAKARKKQKAVKASSYSTVGFIYNLKPVYLDLLDFTDFAAKWGKKALVKLYPKQDNMGKLYPPPHYLVRGSLVRKWRGMSVEEQGSVMEEVAMRWANEEVADETESTAAAAAHVKNASSDNADRSSPSSRKRPKNMAEFETTNSPTLCLGITKNMIRKSHCKDADRVEAGFYRLVGRAYRQKGDHVASNSGEWHHGTRVEGFVIDGGNNNYSWKCVQLDAVVDVGNDDGCGGSEWGFRLYDCDGTTEEEEEAAEGGGNKKRKKAKRPCCDACWENKMDFFDMCREEYDRRN